MEKSFVAIFTLFFLCGISFMSGRYSAKIDHEVGLWAARTVANAALNDRWESELRLEECKEAVRNHEAQYYTFIDRED